MSKLIESEFTSPETSYNNLVLQTALILSIFGVFIEVFNYLTGFDKVLLSNNYAIWGLIMITLIANCFILFNALKNIQINKLGIQIKKRHLFFFCIIAVFFSSCVLGLWSYSFSSFIAPETVDNLKIYTMEQLSKQGQSDEQIEKAMSYMGVFIKPTGIAISNFFSSLSIGILAGLICSFISKNSRKNTKAKSPVKKVL